MTCEQRCKIGPEGGSSTSGESQRRPAEAAVIVKIRKVSQGTESYVPGLIAAPTWFLFNKLTVKSSFPSGVPLNYQANMQPTERISRRWRYDSKAAIGIEGVWSSGWKKHYRSQAEARSYGDIVRECRWHPEAKSLAPYGSKCVARTAGLLRRTPVIAAREF